MCECSELNRYWEFEVVYRAHQSTVGREVAIKIILSGFANRPEFVRRFEAEPRWWLAWSI